MKKIVITILFISVAFFCQTENAGAQEFHIRKMVCVQTEGIFTADAIYLRYRTNGGSFRRYPSSSDLSFTDGTERSNFCYISADKGDTIHVEVWDHDTFDPDDYIGSFEAKVDRVKEQTVTLRQQDGTAIYRLTYVVD